MYPTSLKWYHLDLKMSSKLKWQPMKQFQKDDDFKCFQMTDPPAGRACQELNTLKRLNAACTNTIPKIGQRKERVKARRSTQT